MRLSYLGLLLAAPIAISCRSPVEPHEPSAYVSVLPRQVGQPERDFAVTAESGVLHADGHVTTATPCFGFAASSQRHAATIVVTLRARDGGGCVQASQPWDFRVTVPSVPAGAWTVRVLTQLDPSATPGEVFQATVRVP